MEQLKNVQEKEITGMRGALAFVLLIVTFIVSVTVFILGIGKGLIGQVALAIVLWVISSVVFIGACICCAGFHILNPNEALVLTFFGKYYGTIKQAGWYFVNPFASAYNNAKGGTLEGILENTLNAFSGMSSTEKASLHLDGTKGKKISTKTLTLNNDKQKVNDALGNPIIIGSVVIWRVANPTQAVFNVENYKEFLSIQCDSVIRNIARMYPYDNLDEDADEKTLRGSSQEIAESMRLELQEKVDGAGLFIEEVRITNLAYSDEIAAAMLQRQQAAAIIAARQKIVEGAVGMVKMAIDQLGEEEVVVLDEERKAAMVSNLLVVLCGNKDAQPVVNSSSIY